jgi:penicillin-binding protein 1B
MATTQKQKQTSKAPQRFFTKPRLKILALALLIPFLLASLVLIHYYFKFSRLIETRLATPLRHGDAPSEIYAAAFRLYPGKRIDSNGLIARLKRDGYREDGAGRRAQAAEPFFRVISPAVLEISNALPGKGANTVRVKLNRAGIEEVRDVERSKKVDVFSLRPELISTVFDKNREKKKQVHFNDLPKSLVNAVLASEDKRFFRHSGIDLIRITKALFVDARSGDVVQGGSTLTQQFVKNFFLNPERTWKRKLAEAYLSILLEQRYSKQEIFEFYSNAVYLGQRGSFSIIGFGEAAEAYFNKRVNDLALSESALLVGIIPAPNKFSPYQYRERAKLRRDLVLDLMEENNFITHAEKLEAKKQPLGVKPATILNYSDAPYYVDYVRELLLQEFSEGELTKRSYKVYTTLDPDLQKAAYEAVTNGLKTLDDSFSKRKRHAIPPGTVQASLIAIDPRTGEILAMVGGRNYAESQFNRITEARRQPGSIFKPIVYAAALDTAFSRPESPITVATTVMDEPSRFQFEKVTYEPKNFKNEYHGLVTLRTALMRSLNVATVKVAEMVGFDQVAQTAKKLGLSDDIKPYPSVALGTFEVTPLEMARAYTAFVNNGVLVEPVAIREITTSQGLQLKIEGTNKRAVLAPQTAYLVNSLMQSAINNGTGAGARSRGFTLPAAGKTGTSHDGWFAGFTPDLLCIVWVGFDDNSELNLSGAQSALPIWTEFMKKATTMAPLSGGHFTMPDGIVQVEIDPQTGLLASPLCAQRAMEFFIKGSEPTTFCNGFEQFYDRISSHDLNGKDGEGATRLDDKSDKDKEKKGVLRRFFSIFKD